MKRLLLAFALLVAGAAAGDTPVSTTECSDTSPSQSACTATENVQCACAVASASTPASSLLTGLVHYWTLDEASGTRADSVGGATLTDNNTVTSSAGINATAATFLTANAEFLSSTDATLNFGDNDFTFSVWFKRSLDQTEILLARDQTTGRSYTLDFTAAAFIRFYINGGGGSGDLVQTTRPAAGAWHHVVVWYQKTPRQLGLVLDNGTAVTSTPTSTPPTGTAEFEIGARQFTGSRFHFTGSIDEVGVWNRVLTPAEITTLYNSGAGKFYPSF